MTKKSLPSLCFFAMLIGSFLLNKSFAQQLSHLETADVPSVVRNALQKKYPSANDAIWKKEKDSKFSAQFWDSENDIYFFSYFDEKGEWEKSVMEVTPTSFTEAIRQFLRANYAKAAISSVIVTQVPDNNNIFRIEMELDEKIVTLELNKMADVLSKKEEDIQYKTTKGANLDK